MNFDLFYTSLKSKFYHVMQYGLDINLRVI